MKSLFIFPALLLSIFCLFFQGYAQETRPSANQSKGFFIKNGKLYDANGCAFVPRGVNNGHAWFDHPNGDRRAYNALDNIAALGFNSVRIVWGIHYWVNSDGSFGPTSDDNILRDIIERCIELKLVPMVELHDFTGSNNSSDVATAANWWANRASLVNDYEQHIIVNILNEWGNGSTTDTQWRNAYKSAVSTIRNAGIKATLVIDATEWAKNISPVKTYGSEVLNHDPQKNVAFSTHYYCEAGANSATIRSELGWAAATNEICLMVGEFAQAHADYINDGVCDVKEQTVVEEAQENQQGYFWWAWNSTGDRGVNFSLGDTWEASSRSELTDIGEWLILDSPNGIASTSKRAGVFSGLSCGGSTGTGNVTVRARGTSGSEQIEIRYKDQRVGDRITLSTSYKEYKVQVNNANGNFKVAFVNDNSNRDVYVDWLLVGTTKRQAESRDTNTGAWANGVCGGGTRTEVLHCNGYIGFGTMSDVTSGNVVIRARGNCGSETMVLEVGGSNVKTWNNVGTGYANYTYSGYRGGTIKVKFTNNQSSPCDRNLYVDYLDACGTRIQSESSAVVQTSDWTNGDKQILFTNGNNNYGNPGCGSARTSSTGTKLLAEPAASERSEVFSAYPNPATDQLTVAGGDDYQVTLYDLTGRKVMQHSHLKGRVHLEVGSLRPGMYLMRIYDSKNREVHQRIMIE